MRLSKLPQDPRLAEHIARQNEKALKAKQARIDLQIATAIKRQAARAAIAADAAKNRKKLRRELVKSVGESYGYTVRIVKVPADEREQFRTWAKTQRIASFNRNGATGDMIWNKEWTQFWFKSPETLTAFHFHFKHLVKD